MLNVVPVPDNMFAPDVIADPYAYYGRLRDIDPVHWNETYALWVDHPLRRPGLADPSSRAVLVRGIPGTTRGRPIQLSMSRISAFTITSGITRATSSSSTIGRSIWRCAG